MPRHEENACAVAPVPLQPQEVERVFWPGFPDHPGHEVHKHQATGFGALISFDLGSLDAAKRMLARVRLCSLGESLGGVETLISHPATMTHAGYTQEERDALGITNGLVRISVGCEDAEDLAGRPRPGPGARSSGRLDAAARSACRRTAPSGRASLPRRQVTAGCGSAPLDRHRRVASQVRRARPS